MQRLESPPQSIHRQVSTITLNKIPVNLLEHPLVDPKHLPVAVTLPDMHGNALKFIHSLIIENILILEKKEDYTRIVDIYMADKITIELIQEFRQILEKTTVRQNLEYLRLIGDELCDRGRHDMLTLFAFHIIFLKLEKNGTYITILLSNHGKEFIDLIFIKKITEADINYKQMRSFFNYLITYKELKTREERELKERESKKEEDSNKEQNAVANDFYKKFYKELDDAIDYYLDHINFLDYTRDNSTTPPTLILFTHAPVGLETIKMLAEEYKVEYKDATIDDLCKTIDDINNGNFDIKKLNNQAVRHITWSKNDDPNKPIDLPPIHNGYQLIGVHGHIGSKLKGDSFGSWQPNMFNIDCDRAGKSDNHMKGNHISISEPSIKDLKPKPTDALPAEPLSSAAPTAVEMKPPVKSDEDAFLPGQMSSTDDPPSDPVRIKYSVEPEEKENAEDLLRKFISDVEEKKKQTNCFWFSSESTELSAAKKLLACLNKNPAASVKFNNRERKILNNTDCMLGRIFSTLENERKDLQAILKIRK